MKRCLFLLLLKLCSTALVFSQDALKEFVIEKDDNPQVFYKGKGCTPDVGVIVFYTSIPNLRFSMPDTPSRLKSISAFDTENYCYVLCVQPTDTKIGGIGQYSIAITGTGYKAMPAFMVSGVTSGVVQYFKINIVEDWKSAFESLKREVDAIREESEKRDILKNEKTAKKSLSAAIPINTLPSRENVQNHPDEKLEPSTAYPKKTFLGANFAWSPELQAYGLTIWHFFNRYGGYLSCMSNFSFTGMGTEYVSDGMDGYCNGFMPFYSGNTSTTRISATVGITAKLARSFALYFGGGYGYKALFWETIDGEWIKNSYYSHTGLDIEGGFLFDLKGFVLSVASVSTNFKRIEMKVGIGFAF